MLVLSNSPVPWSAVYAVLPCYTLPHAFPILPFRCQMTKQQLPSKGTLKVEFVSTKRPTMNDKPLTDTEFDVMWLSLVDTKRLAQQAAALEGGCLFSKDNTDGATPLEPLQLHKPRPLSPRRTANSPAPSVAPAATAPTVHVHVVTDQWKLALLNVLVTDCYFTAAQARQVVAAFSYGEVKVEAAVKVKGLMVARTATVVKMSAQFSSRKKYVT